MAIPIQPPFPIFQGNEYDIWSIKMKTLFISQDLWELVDKSYVEEEVPTTLSEVRKKDAKALFFIQQSIAESIFPQISKATKSKEAWDALQTKYDSTIQAAANEGGVITVGMDPAIYKAAENGEIEVLKTKFSEPELPVKLTPKHNTPLHIAAQFGQVECVNWILNNLPSSSSLLQRPNLKGDTPLHLAAREGHLEVVEALLSAAAKLPEDIETGTAADQLMMRIPNKEKDTALHEAVRYDHSDVVDLLIKKDPQLTYGANGTGISPLYMAAERGFTDIVRIIIEKSKETRTSPAYRGFLGRTALHAAVLCNDQEMTRQILEWNPDLTREVDEKGWTPLHCAAERNCDRKIVKQLLDKSDQSVAYLGIKDGNKTALHIAYFHHHKDIIEELLSFYPDCCEQVDSDGRNVFHFAMMKKGDHDFMPGDYLNIRCLRARGLINEKDNQGNTPLHFLLIKSQIFGSYGIGK